MRGYTHTAADRADKLADPERLEALQRSGLLGRSIADRLDHLVFAAARLLMVDLSQINALDQEHQYTVVGWPPDDWPIFPAETSGCTEVVLTGEAFVVPDTKIHPITCELPWVDHFRGYLGVPICYDDHVLGSLCVLTVKPRVWKKIEVEALNGIARLAGMSLDGSHSD